MSKFSEGDKVRCVNAGDVRSGSSSDVMSVLEEDEIYTIEDVTVYGDLYLEETEEGPIFKERFEKVEHIFEVGDRVRIVDDSCLVRRHNVGDTATVRSINNNDIAVKMDSNGQIQQIFADDIELITKGNESDMEDVDTIVVEVDDEDLYDAIVNKAKRFDYYETKGFGDYLYIGLTQKNTYHVKRFSLSAHDPDKTKILGKLSENWNKVVEFIEEERTKIAGKTVEFKEKEIEVGCKTIPNETIEKTLEAIKVLPYNDNGTLKLSSYDVDFDTIREIAEYQLD